MQTQTQTLYTVPQFIEHEPAFTNGALRKRIFEADKNGLNAFGAIIKNGKRVFIHYNKFMAWIEGGAK